ncbi:MAG: hypothetical protein SGARI_007036 [Bacillariaceae sp.]
MNETCITTGETPSAVAIPEQAAISSKQASKQTVISIDSSDDDDDDDADFLLGKDLATRIAGKQQTKPTLKQARPPSHFNSLSFKVNINENSKKERTQKTMRMISIDSDSDSDLEERHRTTERKMKGSKLGGQPSHSNPLCFKENEQNRKVGGSKMAKKIVNLDSDSDSDSDSDLSDMRD